MKRTAEFITGLIGGILGILFSVLIVFGLVSRVTSSHYGESISYADSGEKFVIITFSMALIIQIGLLVLTCFVNKVNHIAYGTCMIVFSIISLLFSFFFILLIPVILQIISGALVFRTLQQKSNENKSFQIHG
ncbi:DUF4064 domain-containing protein [Bacillus cereus group sp. BfR-BA-01380]|uniref:DUF4064 domain-containing protein n=1 Tax=Bacillus cereus group sp. BfR-BA-01380 TaxID=2920324 RepID=UPI001F5A5054|nr:DUF4064 domain-containing protein [Bacillus cereus group sp. BfR-BA-01380]